MARTFEGWLTSLQNKLNLTPKEAATALGVSLTRFYQIRSQATATPYTAWQVEKVWREPVPVELVRGRREPAELVRGRR